MAREQGQFTIEDVLSNLHDKLIRRHPHVFGSARVQSAEEALHRWQTMKAAEQPATGPTNTLDGVSPHQPALQEAYEMSRRAVAAGFEWERFEDLLDKQREEVEELRRAQASGDKEWLEDEAGDLLFVAVNVARYLGYDPELALRRTNRRFRRASRRSRPSWQKRASPAGRHGSGIERAVELVKSREPE
jgi:MazG family protein